MIHEPGNLLRQQSGKGAGGNASGESPAGFAMQANESLQPRKLVGLDFILHREVSHPVQPWLDDNPAGQLLQGRQRAQIIPRSKPGQASASDAEVCLGERRLPRFPNFLNAAPLFCSLVEIND